MTPAAITAVAHRTLYRWATPEAHGLLSDPDIGHIAAVELVDTPDDPVRWRTTTVGLVVATDRHNPPIGPWAELLTTPVDASAELEAGTIVTVDLLAVPTRSHASTEDGPKGSKRRRGTRRFITDPTDQDEWVTSRLQRSGHTEVTVTDRTVTTVHHARTNRTVRAVHWHLTTTVTEPVTAADALYGRRRAHGFGLPLMTPA